MMVKWIEKEHPPLGSKPYVEFINSAGLDGQYRDITASRVSCLGKGRQEIWIGSKVNAVGNIFHEMCHTIGFKHEHQRPVRNDYVIVDKPTSKKYPSNYGVVDSSSATTLSTPYDLQSIMHYGIGQRIRPVRGEAVKRLANSSFPYTVGQREAPSPLDRYGAEHLYGHGQCSFDKYGDYCREASLHKCLTCWGESSEFGCCAYCAEFCHKSNGHEVTPVLWDGKSVSVCDCGKNRHQQPISTFHSTKEKRYLQPHFRCLDCFEYADGQTNLFDVCCLACKNVCHDGHRVELFPLWSRYVAFCGCPTSANKSKTPCQISSPAASALLKPPLRQPQEELSECSYDLKKKDFDCYICYTCKDASLAYKCCQRCKEKCHQGHRTEKVHGSSNSDCTCGKNFHRDSVCTSYLTRSDPVKQKFFYCYDCFKYDEDEKKKKRGFQGCCSACRDICHSGHNTKVVSPIGLPAYCDCGLSVEGIKTKACSIASPASPHCAPFSLSQCSYDQFGDEERAGHSYLCITCWGAADFAFCKYCIEKCHKGHDVKERDSSPKQFYVCHCGRNRHCHQVCSYHATKVTFPKQRFFLCLDCFKYDGIERLEEFRKDFSDEHWQSTVLLFVFLTPRRLLGCCMPCRNICHKRHNVCEIPFEVKAFCDCGASLDPVKPSGECKTRCRIHSPLSPVCHSNL
eukprot:m.164950 g.164950  ORF g.164950 m.164950 type:complete len:682 (+) comp38887_c0_seq2:320-2365(+)